MVRGLTAFAAMMLSACVSYPELANIPRPAVTSHPDTADVEAALQEAARLQGLYARGYSESAQMEDISQLPLIGAAAIAAWILLDNNANAARDVGRIGIAAGTYSAARGQLMAADLSDIYIAGYSGMACILDEGIYFSGTNAVQSRGELEALLQDMATQINDTSMLANKVPLNPSAAELELLRLARTAALQAITTARSAENSGLTEAAAFDRAAHVFRGAVTSVSAKVASRGRQRVAVSFEELRTQLAPKEPEGTEANAAERTSASEVIDDLIAATNGLLTLTARLRASTPGYSEALDRVRRCPERVGP